MCRLYAMRANEETKVECTLVHAQNALLLQSREDLTGRTHSDGWGIAFYHNAHPEVERRASAAFRDLHFSDTAQRIYSKTVIAHVRMATVGSPVMENVHPFVCGHWAFAHNGTVRAFEALGAAMFDETAESLRKVRRGTTDSEQLFLWLLSRLLEAGIDLDRTDGDVNVMTDVLAKSIVSLDERCRLLDSEKLPKLNVVLTDGRRMFVTRWHNSLHCALRQGIESCEICGIPHIHHDNSVNYQAVVIASEPISEEPWIEFPDQSIMTIENDVVSRLRPLLTNDTGTSAVRPNLKIQTHPQRPV